MENYVLYAKRRVENIWVEFAARLYAVINRTVGHFMATVVPGTRCHPHHRQHYWYDCEAGNDLCAAG